MQQCAAQLHKQSQPRKPTDRANGISHQAKEKFLMKPKQPITGTTVHMPTIELRNLS